MSNRNRNLNNLDKQIKKTNDMMNSPCTITEAVQLARGVAEDVVADYHTKLQHLHISMTIQIELLKELVISKGLITEEEFIKMYQHRAEELQRMQQSMMQKSESASTTEMKVEAGDIEIKSE